MQIGICGNPDIAPKLLGIGVDYIEVNVQGFLKPREPDEAFAPNLAAAKASPLPVRAANCFLPGDLPSTGPDVDEAAIVKWATVAFERAKSIGLESIVFGSGGSRQLKPGCTVEQAMDQFVALCKKLGPIAQANGVTVVIEPLNRGECNFLNTLAEGAQAVQRTNHPAVQLLADFFHMLRNEEDPADVAKFGKMLRHCHIAEKANRTACGVDGDDFRPFLRGLRESGYTGRLSFECGWGEGGPTVHAAKAVAELKKQMADVGL